MLISKNAEKSYIAILTKYDRIIFINLKYQAFLMDNNFEQYKLAVDAAEKTTDRRNQSNTLYMAVVSLILTALFLSFQCDCKKIEDILLPQIMLTVLGFLVTLVWFAHMEYFKKMIKLKFTAVKELEVFLNLIPLYKNKDIGRKNIFILGHFLNNSSFEKMIPISFSDFFLLFAVWIIRQSLPFLEYNISNFILIVSICIYSIGLYQYEAKINDTLKINTNGDDLFKKMLNFKDSFNNADNKNF